MTKEPQVRINGKMFFYKQKAPFVASGVSVLGALEYDPEEDKVRCHECGEWFRHVGLHSFLTHGLTAREYKRRHGLMCRTALTTESYRVAQIRRADSSGLTAYRADPDTRDKWRSKTSVRMREKNPMKQDSAGISGELRNERGHCRAQLLSKLKEITWKVGKSPSISDLAEHGLSYSSLLSCFNVRTFNEALEIANLAPNRDFPKRKYDPPLLIELLRTFYVTHQRIPGESDRKRGLIPDSKLYVRHFGTFRKACQEAGLGLAFDKQMTDAKRRAQIVSQAARRKNRLGMTGARS